MNHGSKTSAQWIPLRCSIHIHTFASDGNASLETICTVAAREGIDCVIISDHETLGHGINGYTGSLLVITGEEITPGYHSQITETGVIKGISSHNHLLAVGIHQTILNQDLSPQTLIDLVNEQGGLTFMAHPQEPGHSWETWELSHFTGLEIWTFKAAWKRGRDRCPSKTYAWRNPDAIMDGPTPKELAFWDAQGRQRRVVGIGASDNHGFEIEIDGVLRTLFPWEIGLTAIVSYVMVEAERLADNPVRAVLEGLRTGKVIFSHDSLFPAREFTTRVSSPTLANTYLPGDSLPWNDKLQIEVISPKAANIRVLCDGKKASETLGTRCMQPISSPGVWRVEAELEGRPWVFTNPFYVGLWHE